MSQMVFNRYEKKYLLPGQIYLPFIKRLCEYMEVDSYGLSTICNIYYDTQDDLLVRRSIEDPIYKEKLRLRSYGIPNLNSMVYVEIKKKYKKVVNKRRVSLPLKAAYDYLNAGIHPNIKCQILNELDYMLENYSLFPKLYLAYDRIALYGKEDKEFRVTFDNNIRSRRVNVGLEYGDKAKNLLPPDWYLMESKVMGASPLWFTRLLSEFKIYPTSFSKYGNVYKAEHGVWDFGNLVRHNMENWNLNTIDDDYYDEETRRTVVC